MHAGSCVVFTSEKPIAASQRHEIEAGGVGERTAEGYGQVCFNDPVIARTPTSAEDGERVKQDKQPVSPSASLDANNLAYTHLLEAEAWKQFIRRAALAILPARYFSTAMYHYGNGTSFRVNGTSMATHLLSERTSLAGSPWSFLGE
jgi:hypothetical protein